MQQQVFVTFLFFQNASTKFPKEEEKIKGFSWQSFLLIAVSACANWISWVMDGGIKPFRKPAQLRAVTEKLKHISCDSSWGTNHGITNHGNPTVYWHQPGALLDKSCNTRKKKQNTLINCCPKLVRLLTPLPIVHITEGILAWAVLILNTNAKNRQNLGFRSKVPAWISAHLKATWTQMEAPGDLMKADAQNLQPQWDRMSTSWSQTWNHIISHAQHFHKLIYTQHRNTLLTYSNPGFQTKHLTLFKAGLISISWHFFLSWRLVKPLFLG